MPLLLCNIFQAQEKLAVTYAIRDKKWMAKISDDITSMVRQWCHLPESLKA